MKKETFEDVLNEMERRFKNIDPDTIPYFHRLRQAHVRDVLNYDYNKTMRHAGEMNAVNKIVALLESKYEEIIDGSNRIWKEHFDLAKDRENNEGIFRR